MADDVIDIIARLSFDTNNADLQKAISATQEEIDNINTLNAALQKQQAIFAATAAAEIQKRNDITVAINNTKAAIDKQTSSLLQNINANKTLQDAYQKEAGIIGSLQNKLGQLQSARVKATNPTDIAAYNNQIAAVNQQIQGLTASTSSLFGGLLGSNGGIVNQLLRGTLAGFGIGSGFGIVTRAVSALIEYAQAELDTTAKAEKLQAANESLEKSFDDLANSVAKLGEQEVIAFQSQNGLSTTDALQRQADAVKALGVTNGETHNAAIAQLDAENKVREANVLQLQRQQKAQDDVLGAIQKSAKFANEYVGQPDVIAGSADNDPSKNKNVQYTLFNQTLRTLNSADLPPDLINKLIISLNKSYSEGADIVKALNDQLLIYTGTAQKAKDATLKAQEDIDNAKIALQQKTNEEIYQLNLDLQKRLQKGGQDAEITGNNIQIAGIQNNPIQSPDTLQAQSDLREKNIKVQLQEQIDAIDQQEALSVKAGTDSIEIQQKFQDLRLQAQQESNNKTLTEQEGLNQSLRQLATQQTGANTQILTGQDSRDATRSSAQLQTGVSQGNQANFNQYKHSVDEQNQQILDTHNAYYQSQYDLAVKANASQDELDTISERQDTDYKLLKEQQYRNLLDIYQNYLTDFEAISAKSQQEETTGLNAQADTVIKSLSDKLGNGLSSTTYEYKKQLITLQTQSLDLSSNQIPTAQSDLNQAKTNFNAVDANNDIVQNNPAASTADKTASTATLSAASNQVNTLNDTVSKLQISLNETNDQAAKLQKQQIVSQIDDYQTLVTSVVSAYDAINEAKQKSLDVEISIREQQLQQANVLAARGNTSALKQQQELLDKAEQQKELAAKREIEVNEALTVSNSILTIAKAAVEGGAGAAFTIAAAVIALGVGIAEATSLAKQSGGSGTFAEGGFTGHGGKYETAGTVHKGEFVFNQEKTAKYLPMFEAIHKGYDPIMYLKPHQDSESAKRSNMSDGDIKLLAAEMKRNTAAVENNKTEVHAQFNEHGIALITTRFQAAERRRFNA